ncbi:MAG: hypothetical protein EVA65_16520 [Oceanococcus sp.]|nr:MAG: hypothetical protein EVA65_16520 [Oceanococcus sp.]
MQKSAGLRSAFVSTLTALFNLPSKVSAWAFGFMAMAFASMSQAQVDLVGDATTSLTAARDDGLSVGAVVISVVCALIVVSIIIGMALKGKRG